MIMLQFRTPNSNCRCVSCARPVPCVPASLRSPPLSLNPSDASRNPVCYRGGGQLGERPQSKREATDTGGTCALHTWSHWSTDGLILKVWASPGRALGPRSIEASFYLLWCPQSIVSNVTPTSTGWVSERAADCSLIYPALRSLDPFRIF